jgi:hypothetical protein
MYSLQQDGTYAERSADPDGWWRSPSTGVEMKQAVPGKLAVRMNGDATTHEEIPD